MFHSLCFSVSVSVCCVVTKEEGHKQKSNHRKNQKKKKQKKQSRRRRRKKRASSSAENEWGHTPWTRWFWLWVRWSWSHWQIRQSIPSFSESLIILFFIPCLSLMIFFSLFVAVQWNSRQRSFKDSVCLQTHPIPLCLWWWYPFFYFLKFEVFLALPVLRQCWFPMNLSFFMFFFLSL